MILVLGYFGYVTNQLDGQTVKTRDIRRLLEEQDAGEVDFYDTQQFRVSKMSIFSMFAKVCRCDSLVYLPAHGNLKYIFPVIFLLSKIFGVKIDYFVVGGWLSEYLKNLPLHRRMLHHIKGIHVETQKLRTDLERNYGLKNVDIFPNFRFFDFTPDRKDSSRLRLVFMARINKMKGLDWIFNLAEYISKHKLQSDISITFYGPIYPEDEEYFRTEVEQYDFVEYKGALQPEDIYPTISQYDVMLLPTHYYTEGLPGSVVDAYISGVPVIVTEWKHAHEFVDDGKSGFIIPFENGEDELIEKVLYLRNNPGVLSELQEYALKKREEFTPPLSV